MAIGAVTAVVSLSYMTFVALTPASQRPYVDGSTNDSVYQQVFDYNGFSRVGQASPNEELGRTLGTPLFSQAEPPPAWNRLLAGSDGRDTGWLLPAAVIAAAGILVARRGEPRTDLPRAGALLWGTWLIVLAVVFTVSTTMNSYYAGALSPAVAGLLGIGTALAWERRGQVWVAVVAAGTVLVTVAYAASILPTRGTGLPPGLASAAVVLGVAAAAALLWSGLRGRLRPRAVPATALVLAGAALLVVPAAASASVVADGLGPFDTPFQSTETTTFLHHVFAPQPSPAGLSDIEAARHGAPFLMAAQTSAVAAPFIYATGGEVLPLGGYTGTVPAPSAVVTRAMIAAGDFHLALVASPEATASTRYITGHCLHVAPKGSPSVAPRLKIYYCLPSSA